MRFSIARADDIGNTFPNTNAVLLKKLGPPAVRIGNVRWTAELCKNPLIRSAPAVAASSM